MKIFIPMKLFLKTILSVVLLILLYFSTSAALMLFPVFLPSSTFEKNTPITDDSIALTHSLAHTNIIINLSKSSVPWDALLKELVPTMKGYLIVGWGDSDTYQSSPTWGDLKLSVALRAMFLNTTSALHVRYTPTLDILLDPITPLHISQTTSRAIEDNILNSFRERTPTILAPGYDTKDYFYHAKGSYNLFKTCNTWAGDVLRHSGVNMSLWTPLSYNVIHSLPKP